MKYFSSAHNRGENLRPPDIYEYFVDNFWFETVDLENELIDEPLRGEHKADVVIVGGGYTGLSSAYHIRERFPDKKILLLEGACCGYGASGRNGGFCIATSLMNWSETDPARMEMDREVSLYGLEFIKRMIDEHGVACDFEENGMLEVALNEKQVRALEKFRDNLHKGGFEATLVHGKDLELEISSPAFVAGVINKHGAILNPAKLVREMKRVVESVGVVVRERSLVTRITPGKTHRIDTELGVVHAPVLILATNAYSHKLGFFKNYVYPISVFQVATAPLTPEQWETIGWQNRQGLSDMRNLYSYLIPTTDGRILMGGSDFTYYSMDRLASGNDKKVTRNIIRDLHTFFPSIEGIEIEHAWGGTTAGTLNYTSSVGVIGEHKNIYYGTGFSEGVPTTQTTGRMIADLMVGETNAFTTHYTVNRDIPWAGPLPLRGIFARGAKWWLSIQD